MSDPGLLMTEKLMTKWMPFITALSTRLKQEIEAAALGELPDDNPHIRRAMEVVALIYLIDDRPTNEEMDIMTVANAVQSLNSCLHSRINCADKGIPYHGFWHMPGKTQ